MQQAADFTKAKKPVGFTAYHYAVMLCLMCEGEQSQLSQATIAERIGMSIRAVRNIFKDLRAWKWIGFKSGKRQYNTNVTEVRYANLPHPEPAQALVISENASTLAEGYKSLWEFFCKHYKNKRGWKCTRPLRPDWKKRWATVFQLRLNEGYAYNELAGILNSYSGPNSKANPKSLVAGPQSRKLFPVKEVQQ